jgi:hypothetical protein
MNQKVQEGLVVGGAAVIASTFIGGNNLHDAAIIAVVTAPIAVYLSEQAKGKEAKGAVAAGAGIALAAAFAARYATGKSYTQCAIVGVATVATSLALFYAIHKAKA